MQIVALKSTTTGQRADAAAVLVEAFRRVAPEAWPTLETAHAELRQALEPGRIGAGAINEDGSLVGWIGAIPGYDGNVWELHPLVVHPACHGAGIGTALVRWLEDEVIARGGLTIWLGTDDVNGTTSLSGIELYPDPLASLASIRSIDRHPFEFYRRLGYAIAGVVPDANGFGKPDILMAKRVGRPPARWNEP